MNEIESYRGLLEYSDQKVSVELENGLSVAADEKDDLFITLDYEIILNGSQQSIRRHLKRPVKILPTPFIVRRYRYLPNNHSSVENIFPPSTNGFYSRLQVQDIEEYRDYNGSVSVFCFLHQCPQQKDRLWLTITNSETGEIYESFLIRNYEANIFLMPNDTQLDFVQLKRYQNGIRKSDLFDAEEFLSSPSPTWTQLSRIMDGITFPNLKRFNTLEETISQLIPPTFPEIARTSLCIFLGLIAQDKIVQEDPDDVSVKFALWNIVSSLYNSHQLYAIQNIRPPPYVRLMHLTARKQIQGIGRTVREDIEKSDWLMFWHLLHDSAKNIKEEMPILLDIIERSNRTETIAGKFIPSKTVAHRSQKAWLTRLVCNSSDTSPSLICTPNLETIGLRQSLYLGAANRWPHAHMSYITRLGTQDTSLHLQRMILPVTAFNRIRRFIPSLLDVNWTTMTYNPDLYTDDWSVRVQEVLRSPKRTRPLTILRKKYYSPVRNNLVSITPTEALVLDIIATPFHMMYLKERAYLFEKLFGIKKQLFLRTARSLVEKGVLRPQYLLIPRLPTLVTIAYGRPKSIISIADAFLSGTPTCTAYICNNGTHAVFLSRVPPNDSRELAFLLPQIGHKNGISIRCFRSSTLRSYNHSLFQRLLQQDGTWNDDVSGFLSQAQAKRAEITKASKSKIRRSRKW
jgi:hypothetical protein